MYHESEELRREDLTSHYAENYQNSTKNHSTSSMAVQPIFATENGRQETQDPENYFGEGLSFQDILNVFDVEDSDSDNHEIQDVRGCQLFINNYNDLDTIEDRLIIDIESKNDTANIQDLNVKNNKIKQYKRYTEVELFEAIEEVKCGQSILKMAKKYSIPSRTLYAKIKKNGAETKSENNVNKQAK